MPAHSLPTTMNALCRDRYGDVDQLTIRRVAVSRPARGQVLVRVQAAGIARSTWHLLHGLPLVARAAGFGARRPKQPILGTEMAGVVEAVGDDAGGLRPGDAVFGAVDGAFAEFALARPRNLATAPTPLDAVHAAALPDSGLTALQALDRVGAGRGHRVLVIGASGGVGSYAVQMAVALGAEVTGVCSAAKADLVRNLGAAHVVDYASQSIGEAGHRFDAVLDIAGNRSLRELRAAMTPRGRLVIIGGEDGGRWFGGLHRQLGAVLLSPFVRQRLGFFVSTIRTPDLDRLRTLVEGGEVRPLVDRVLSLADVPAGLHDLGAGLVRGKLVVRIGE